MFSIKKSCYFWVRSNAVLLLIAALLLTNLSCWNKYENGISLFLFELFSECFLILLSLVYGTKTKKQFTSPRKRILKKSNVTQGILVFLFISIFFNYALNGMVPFPSSLLYISLTINLIMAIYSLIAPSWVIKIYEYNIYEVPNGWISDLLRFFLVFAWSVNYEVQVVLYRLPFLLQRLMGIIFIFVLLINIFLISSMF
ncbi:hypothetical protein [Bacillus haynesii]|uniref:hypothetical protein n=1 Tax=Bacillus haynesii TaxID=1925021 RepID=UPI002281F25E|nr:hypothetical protein [Bacillus haynesii]MCY9261744.1 hypothetical protein [Bacillus haynesii]MEC0698073.1 hypothetical protein [Bacillus haynesii]MEC1533581.1 hypothetical protein [Bacillus haynesii]